MTRDYDALSPGWIKTVDRRRDQRVTVDAIAAHCESHLGIALCDIEDISIDGARMATDLPVGTEVMLELYLADDRKVRATARVVHRLYPKKSIGLLFDGLGENERSLIRDAMKRARKSAD